MKEESNLKIVFFAISCIFSYLIISELNFYFEWWMVIGIPVYALWLNVPIFFNDEREEKLSIHLILGYLVWIAIQWIIYYLGLTPPSGYGINGF